MFSVKGQMVNILGFVTQEKKNQRYYLDIHMTREKTNFNKCYFGEIQNRVTKYICTILSNTSLLINEIILLGVILLFNEGLKLLLLLL